MMILTQCRGVFQAVVYSRLQMGNITGLEVLVNPDHLAFMPLKRVKLYNIQNIS